jgi:hypothetical protein
MPTLHKTLIIPVMLLLQLPLTGCFEDLDLPWSKVEDTGYPDIDGDGWPVVHGDCDDTDPDVNPDAQEICDDAGIDENCDGLVNDEDPTVSSEGQRTWFPDEDGDGYGADAVEGALRCEPDEHWSASEQGDCDDGDPSVNPDGQEVCDEAGVDEDCDGLVDDEDPDVFLEGEGTWYFDNDGDGYGGLDTAVMACVQPSGSIDDHSDCDDGDPDIHPNAQEICDDEDTDEDCDGWADDVDPSVARDTRSIWYADLDHDGFADPTNRQDACDQPEDYLDITLASDCDDSDPEVNPGAQEVCDEADVDEDCDGISDDDDPSVDSSGFSQWFADVDGDGYGDLDQEIMACDPGATGVTDSSDCNDGDQDSYPGAAERCDGMDNDCDGLTDEDDAIDQPTWYLDADGDGHGVPGSTRDACDLPGGYADRDDDCDDTDADTHPGAAELCDGHDDDCDGVVDDDDPDVADAITWYLDGDGDGWGDDDSAIVSCSPISSGVLGGGDCDDSDDSVNPAVDELCDGLDNDCDGTTDEDDALDASDWYLDADGDGWGDSASTARACTQPSGMVLDDGDCDDADGTRSPGTDELCNGIDDDCDGTVDEDEAVDVGHWYADIDADGYGDAGSLDTDCEQPPDYVADSSDCNDVDPDVHPGADELCDGRDNDCDGTTDEDDAIDATSWYADSDADGYGDPSSARTACSQPSGDGTAWMADDSDCDDSRADVNPAATERCDDDDVDEDCDGASDDADASTDPAGMSTWFRDLDGDGTGSSGSGTQGPSCDPGAGYVADDGDCDDADPSVHPLHQEVCDGVDNDCDSGTSEDGAISIGSAVYGDLAEAMAAATSGAVITICDGSYQANLETTVPITLRSRNGSAATILDGGAKGPVFTMGDDLILEGLTIRGGYGVLGGAIDGSGASGASLDISDCILEDNDATDGGAIYGVGLTLGFSDSELAFNTASGRGGAMYLAAGPELDLDSVDIHDNEASEGGGLYLEDQIVLGGLVYDNFAARGGGLFLSASSAMGSTIHENLASSSGGGALLDDNASLLGCDIQLNLAQSGGGVFIQGASSSTGPHPDTGALTTISLNEASVHGGGICAQDAMGLSLRDTTLNGNSSSYLGGGLYIDGGDSLTGAELAVSGNTAANSGGGLYITGLPSVALEDIEISANHSGGSLSISGATITDNQAGSLGGGVHLSDVTDAVFTSMTLARNASQGGPGGGFYLGSGVLLYASGSYGAGVDANSPDDIGTSGASYTFSSWADCDSDLATCTGS